MGAGAPDPGWQLWEGSGAFAPWVRVPPAPYRVWIVFSPSIHPLLSHKRLFRRAPGNPRLSILLLSPPLISMFRSLYKRLRLILFVPPPQFNNCTTGCNCCVFIITRRPTRRDGPPRRELYTDLTLLHPSFLPSEGPSWSIFLDLLGIQGGMNRLSLPQGGHKVLRRCREPLKRSELCVSNSRSIWVSTVGNVHGEEPNFTLPEGRGPVWESWGPQL